MCPGSTTGLAAKPLGTVWRPGLRPWRSACTSDRFVLCQAQASLGQRPVQASIDPETSGAHSQAIGGRMALIAKP